MVACCQLAVTLDTDLQSIEEQLIGDERVCMSPCITLIRRHLFAIEIEEVVRFAVNVPVCIAFAAALLAFRTDIVIL